MVSDDHTDTEGLNESHNDTKERRVARKYRNVNDAVPQEDVKTGESAPRATRKRRRRDSAALLDEEAKLFIRRGKKSNKSTTYIIILWKRVKADAAKLLPSP